MDEILLQQFADTFENLDIRFLMFGRVLVEKSIKRGQLN